MAPYTRVSLNRLAFTVLLLFSITHASQQWTTIPRWKVTPSSKTSTNVTALSLPEVDTKSWYSIGSKGTLMSTLLANNIYDENDIFFSTNLQKTDAFRFHEPWFYRFEDILNLTNSDPSWYTLRTHGISSRADVYLNGHQIANSDNQVGAYAGYEYDVSKEWQPGKVNVLLVKVYPTDYNRDFTLGFVDWNPYPTDNGTGVWRDVEVKRSGTVGISNPRVKTTLEGNITLFVDVRNLDSKSIARASIQCGVHDPDGKSVGEPQVEVTLEPSKQQKVTLHTHTNNPQLWWPRQWGSQPLYTVQCHATLPTNHLSDSTTPITFGIRTVTSRLSASNDTTFHINAHPFQVLGAGYTSDIFLRFDPAKLRAQFQYVLDMGLNTVRLEGKQEHPYLYELADEMGLMVLAGWECCDKWEGWAYNEDGSGEKWGEGDYAVAGGAMRHEAGMMQVHPSVLGFLVGSDYWPDDRATRIYLDALKAFDWDTPIISSAAQRGSPSLLGNGGMKMEGPYEWVPPNYWYSPTNQLGSAYGFGSELGAGVGTPEIGSLKKFLSASDLEDLWKAPEKGLYHMSQNTSSFHTRTIYNNALWARYGAPTSLDDYLLKAQMMDYEATRAQFEAYASRWNHSLARPATGAIYWMLNNAWPSLHWNLFDYYLHPGGSYFGVKSALSSSESAAYNYEERSIYLVNHANPTTTPALRVLIVDLIDLNGTSLYTSTALLTSSPNTSTKSMTIPTLHNITSVTLLRLQVHTVATNDTPSTKLSSKTYWLPPMLDTLDYPNSTWYHTPVTTFADYTSLSQLPRAALNVRTSTRNTVTLWNKSTFPAVYVRLNLVQTDGNGGDVIPVRWSENYITLWPGEKRIIDVEYGDGSGEVGVEFSGWNVEGQRIVMGSRE